MSTSHLVTNWPRKLQETTAHRTHFKHFNMASPLMFDNFEFHSFRNQKHQQKCVPLHSFKPILEMIPNRGCHPNHDTSMPSLRTSNSGSNSWAWAGLCDISQQKRLPSSCACGAVGGSVHFWHLPQVKRGFNPSITWIFLKSSIWNMTAWWNKSEKVHQLGYLTFELVIGLLSFTSINSQLGWDEHHWN